MKSSITYPGNSTQRLQIRAMKRDHANRLQYADLGSGGEVWHVYKAKQVRMNNGNVETERETLHVNDGTKRIALVDTEPEAKAITKVRKPLEAKLTEAEIDKTTIRYQYDNHLGSASLELDEKGRALDNIYIERFWRTIKYQHIILDPAENSLDLYIGIKQWIDRYHNRDHQGIERKNQKEIF